MAITPLPGYIIDPNNPNNVISKSQYDLQKENERLYGSSSGMTKGTDSAGNTVYVGDPSINPQFKYSNTPVSSIYNFGGRENYTTSPYDTALTGQSAYYQQASQPVDEATIRANKARELQAEIDAVSGIYARKREELKRQGEGRLGTVGAIQARRGLLGSDFGAAQQAGVENQNQGLIQGNEAELANIISSIQSEGRRAVDSEIALKNKAREESANKYIETLATQDQRTAQRASNAAKQLYLSGATAGQVTPQLLKIIADSYGISSEALSSQYGDLLKTATEEKAKKDQEAAKLVASGYRNVSPGETVIDSSGKVVYKAPAKSTSGVAGLTPYQQFSATQSIAKDTQARTESAREMARQAQLIDQSYNSILSGGDRSLNTQAIITSFNKILDPSSVVRESEYDRTAQGQSLLAQLEGKVQNISSGGAGVTEATLKEASDIAKKYLEGAKKSIEMQNKRAEQMAAQFGLNPAFVTSTYQAPEATVTNIITAPDGTEVQIID